MRLKTVLWVALCVAFPPLGIATLICMGLAAAFCAGVVAADRKKDAA